MKLAKFITLLCLISLFIEGCKEEQNINEDPYAGGREPLGIQLSAILPIPSEAYPGQEVIFKAKGLLAWSKSTSDEYAFEFFISGEKAQIKSATDSSITIIVPASVSSGITHILLQGQVFYGPRLNILGNIKVDKEYGIKTGTNGAVFNFLENNSQKGSYYMIGGFNNIQGTRRTQIAYVDARGNLAELNSTRYNVSEPLRYIPFSGTGGVFNRQMETLSSMSYLSNGKIVLSGSFAGYETKASNGNYYPVLNNITVLNNDLSLDTMMVTFKPYTGSTAISRGVPRFNGGALQPILRSFVTSDDKIIAVGNLLTYAKANYELSNPIENVYDYTNIASVIRLEKAGGLDTKYRIGNFKGGTDISDAYIDSEDGVVVVGNFGTFDDAVAPHIVRLDKKGAVDPQYMSNIGSGADGEITMIRYNKTLGKAVIVGNFTRFNGQARNGIAILDRKGNLEPDFIPQPIEGGRVNFSTILNSGKVVISGTFQKYDGINRPGFLILDKDGKATQRFNVPGEFVGKIYQVIETLTTTGANGLLVLGDFTRFNGEKINNVVMLEVDF